MAVSWGGYESLIMPGCATVKEEDFDTSNKDQRKLRMYVELEDPQYIIEDMEKNLTQ